MEKADFNFYYGKEAEQFSFFRIPRALVKEPYFKGLSSDAKLLYGLMLDRMGLSMKNDWLDVKNRVYIIYKIEDIMDDLGCSKSTSIKILKELDTIGLIEKIHSGATKPDIIYVKNFILSSDEEKKESNKEEPKRSEEKDTKEDSISGYQKNASCEVKNFGFNSKESLLHGVKNFDLNGKENLFHEVKNLDPNYINNNYTKSNNTNLIYPSREQERLRSVPSDRIDGMDTMDETIAYRVLVRKNLEYDHHMKYAEQYKNTDLFQEIYEIVCDIVCINRKKIRINGQDCPYEIVKSRFLKLNHSHIEYVMDCLRKNTTKVANIRAYLITALYNAPLTINSYYQQKVQHDMYGER